MSNQSVIEILNSRAINDEYLYELLFKAQVAYGAHLLGKTDIELDRKSFIDLLKFADILSKSEDVMNRNVALKIISVLYDSYISSDEYKLIAKSVLIKLGNFPSLNIINGNDAEMLDFELDYFIKNIFQKTSHEERIFTDAQYELFQELKNNNHYSFSATTSFGKSFLLGEYVNWIISNGNASQNIAFLVPSRALITQVENDLRTTIKDERYKIITTPEIPYLYKNKKFIFVLTPERLIYYFSKKNPPISTLIIDEAQKMVSYDSRSPVFYHAISLAKQKSINLFFASPNVPNPDIFLNLVGNSTNESVQIEDINVTKNIFFIDLVQKCIKQYLEFCEEQIQQFFCPFTKLEETILLLSKENQSLIYCNSINDTMLYADKLSKSFSKNNYTLNELSNFIKEQIHEKYGLAEMVKKGIAVHFGSLPQIVRLKLEEEYKAGNILYLFTTSTLLEGVNLPAKNIFILNEKIGNSRMSELDFRNLIGRAGRLNKELFGNVFIVKSNDKRWDGKSLNLLKMDNAPKLESEIVSGKNAFYKKVGQTIVGESLSKSTSLPRKKIIQEYATILSYQHKENLDSILFKKMHEKNKNSSNILKKIEGYEIPSKILMTSIAINPVVQEEIFTNKSRFIFPEDISYETCKLVLEKLFDIYNWEEEENKNTLGKRNRLGYFATLMIDWIQSKPLNIIIKSVINFHVKNKMNISLDFHKTYEVFNQENPRHIDFIVNQIMRDLETTVRFSIRNYIINYLQLTNQNDSHWRDYLDYGTDKKLVLELQKLGLDRQTSIELYKKGECYFELDSGNQLSKIDKRIIEDSNISDSSRKAIQTILEEL